MTGFALHNVADTAATTGIRCGVIVVIAVVVRFVANRAITRLVRRSATGIPIPLRERLPGSDSSPTLALSERRRQRAETIASVLRSVTTFVVYGIAFVMVLSQAGLNIAPVLTGAGIVGVAVGFGAQSLVRDFFSGTFVVLEDQYGVGDVVDLGVATGTVEAVGLRTTRLRDATGSLWHVPNGQVNRVGNLSQGWSRATVDVMLPYSASYDDARKTLLRIADEVAADPQHRDAIRGEPEVTGIEDVGKDGLVVRVLVRTQPERSDSVQRALRAGIVSAIDAGQLTVVGAPAAAERTRRPEMKPRPARKRTATRARGSRSR